ncbi:MAG: type II secretion system protein N [Gammaproteobacteria bacterium]
MKRIKRIILYSSVGLLIYLLALLWLMPAERWFALWQQTAPAWTASRLDGNIFSGSVQQLRYAQRDFGDIEWHWLPSRLLRGQLAYSVHLSTAAPDHQLSGRLVLSWSRSVSLEMLQGQLPTSVLQRWLELPDLGFSALVAPERLNLTLTGTPVRLQTADGLIKVHQIVIRNAAQGIKPMSLGALQLQLDSRQDTIHATAQDLRDPENGLLALQADIILNPDGRYRITGQISPRPSADESVRALLQLLLGTARDSTHRLNLSGRLAF